MWNGNFTNMRLSIYLILLFFMSTQQHLSSLGIVHRDLACRNILVDCGKLLKVSDFGLSREIEDYYTASSLTKLPIRWMAPESITHQKYSEKSDV